ncbi:MAG: ATP-binding protein [Myxococcales bacterium]|nr:ATP-binding protein [Myxococcales bacterium]
MGRLARLLDGLERVLALAEERMLRDRAPAYDGDFFARHLAFRFEPSSGGGRLVGIPHPALFALDDLVGVDRNVERLVRNTEQHVRGLPANNALLYGERGTGKSSAVRGLLARFGAQGLRMVEVHRDELIHLPHVLAAIAADGGRHRFLLFVDDLSFGPGEAGYRELKAALEGSLEGPPASVRIVATSNRRHLLPESMADNRGAHVDEAGELHLGEALDEKLALSDRFGLKLGFYPFDQDTYLAIVRHCLARANVDISEGSASGGGVPSWECVRADALRFALERASRSGRVARQFADDLAGRLALERATASTPDGER